MSKSTELDKSKYPVLGISSDNLPARILQVPNSLLICEPEQSEGLIDILVQAAQKNVRKFCVVDAADPVDFERLLTDVHFNSETKSIQVKAGPLWECLEDDKGGILIITHPLAPTAEGLFNGIFDKISLLDLSGERTISISSRLQIVGIHVGTRQEFKISQVAKSWRDRFQQHYWLPDSKELPLETAPFLQPLTKLEEKSAAAVIDCHYYIAEQLRSYLFHSYPLDEKGVRALKRGALANLFSESEPPKQIKLKNLDTNDPSVKKLLQELQHSPLQQLDGYTYDLRYCQFFLKPVDEKQLRKKTASKKLTKIKLSQLKDFSGTEWLWWLNRQNTPELYELLYSEAVPGQARHVWRSKPGFLRHFIGENLILVIYQSLATADWHRLIEDDNIKSLYVLDNVFIPAPWDALFSAGTIPESKITSEKTSRVQVYLCKPAKQASMIKSLKEQNKNPVVIATSSDHGIELLQDYDDKRHYKPGLLWKALSESRSIIISGDTLVSKLPNLFNPHEIIAASNGEIQEFKSQITVVIEPKAIDQHPCLQILPKTAVKTSSNFNSDSKTDSDKTLSMLFGYEGIKTALHQGHQMIFVKGPKASGKSYSVTRLVEDKIAQVFTYTLSPSTKFTDMQAKVLEWAQSNPSEDKRLRILVLDEINLASPETLLWLQAIVTTPETIILPGNKIISLTPEHRVLGLMNKAEETAGRQIHSVLEPLACSIEFMPLNDDELKKIIRRHYDLVKKEGDNTENDLNFLIELRNALHSLDPDLELTVRDFQAIIARKASWEYLPPEMKAYTQSQVPLTSNTLLYAAFQVISAQLSKIQREAFRHWLQSRVPETFEDKPSPLCAMWIDNLLKQNPNLWNTSSSRHLMGVVLGYLQTHAFYQQQKKRLMPGKFGLLLLGETNTGKTYLSNFLLEAWGYQKGKNWCEWNAGAHGDLAALIQKNWMTSIHEANMLATEVLEGAINAIVPSEDNCEFGLILTANAGYRYREILSEPLLSRLHVINIENSTAEEILHLSKLPKEDREILLTHHYQAGALASIRGLLNAIQLYNSGVSLSLVCEMIYGLLKQETQKTPPNLKIATPNVFADFLAINKCKNLIVCESKGVPQLGVLIREQGIIEIPPASGHGENHGQYQFDIILLRALEYQYKDEAKAFQELSHRYPASYSRIDSLKKDYPINIKSYEFKKIKVYARSSQSVKLFSSKTASSGGQYLPSVTKVIAEIRSNPSTHCIPLNCYEMDEKSGLPVLENEQFKLTDLFRHFYPELLPSGSKESIQVSLKPPVQVINERIPLFTLPGYYPKILNSEEKVVWHEGQFYAGVTDSFSKDENFQYILVSENTPKTILISRPKLACGTFRIDENQFNYQIRQCLEKLRDAEKIQDLPKLLDSLAQSLSRSFTYLDRNNYQLRQELKNAYQTNDLKQVISYCLSKKIVVCIESAIILYVLCQPILAKHGIPVYLSRGLSLADGEVTDEGHSFILVQWSAESYPIAYDPTPNNMVDTQSALTHRVVKSTTSTSFCMPPNPLLNYYKKNIVDWLQSLLSKLYKFSLKSQRSIYQMNPPGMLHPVREYLGLPAFELSLFDQKRTPQALLTTSFPYLEAGKNFYEHYSCIHFLAEILLEKQFKLLVWTKAGAVAAANADIFIDLLMNQLQIPTSEDIKKLNYPFPCQIMDETHWREFLLEYSQILSKFFAEEKYTAYSRSMESENYISQNVKNLRNEAIQNQENDDKLIFNMLEMKNSREEYKYHNKEMDFYTFLIAKLNQKINGRILCTGLSLNDIHKFTEPNLLIVNCHLNQTELDEIFKNFLFISKSKWTITFNGCEFSGNIHFENLPSIFNKIEFQRCKILSSNIRSLPSRNYKIIWNSEVNDSEREVDSLFNCVGSNFNLLIHGDVFPACIKINSYSNLSKLTILRSYYDNTRRKIILEGPLLINTKTNLDISYLLKLDEIKEEKLIEPLISSIYNNILKKAENIKELIKFQFVLDKASPALQEKFLYAISELQKHHPLIGSLGLYCADEAINCFIEAFPKTDSELTSIHTRR